MIGCRGLFFGCHGFIDRLHWIDWWFAIDIQNESHYNIIWLHCVAWFIGSNLFIFLRTIGWVFNMVWLIDRIMLNIRLTRAWWTSCFTATRSPPIAASTRRPASLSGTLGLRVPGTGTHLLLIIFRVWNRVQHFDNSFSVEILSIVFSCSCLPGSTRREKFEEKTEKIQGNW